MRTIVHTFNFLAVFSFLPQGHSKRSTVRSLQKRGQSKSLLYCKSVIWYRPDPHPLELYETVAINIPVIEKHRNYIWFRQVIFISDK